jgi:WD40 repeat protein/serine/threonine protein kinase
MRTSTEGSTVPRSRDRFLEDLIAEVTDRLQNGDAVDLSVILADHPGHADTLRRILPTIEIMAQFASSAASPSPGAAPSGLARVPAIGVLGDFRVLREVGRGGMGIVYEAIQISLNRRVALKVLPFAAGMDPRQLLRFQNEAQAAAGLHHTNIVPVFSVGCERGVHYYAMQFIAGQSLADVIADLNEPAPTAPAEPAQVSFAHSQFSEEARAGGAAASRSVDYIRRAAHLAQQAAVALEYAHSLGVIHRDIKPANLLLDVGGNLWVADFGLARLLSDSGVTMTGDIVGTLRYMSPEQALGQRIVVDHRTDIYSIGVTFYELLALRPAFQSSDRPQLLRDIADREPPPLRGRNPAVPTDLETILLKAMSKDRDARYATAQEFADDLVRFLEHRPIQARRPGLLGRAAKWSRRHSGLVASAALISVVAVFALAVGTLLIGREKTRADHERGQALQYLSETRRHANALEWELYVGRLNSAQTEFSAGQVARAEQLLDACPPSYRGWEWFYEKHLAHLDRLTFPERALCVIGLAFNPDGSRLLSVSRPYSTGIPPSQLRLYDTSTAQVVWSNATKEAIVAAAFCASEPLVAVGRHDGAISVFDARHGTPRGSVGGHPWDAVTVRAVALAPDGKTVAAAHLGRPGFELWDVEKGSLVGAPEGTGDAFESLVFSPDGKWIASGGQNGGLVALWDAASGELKKRMPGHTGQVFAITFSPDGTRIASGGLDRLVRIWDRDRGVLLHTLSGPNSFIHSIAFSPDGTLLAAAGEDGGARLWDAHSGAEIAHLRGHREPLFALAFSRDGARLATGDRGGTVKLWDVATDHHLRPMRHKLWVSAVAFSPNGGLVASGGRDRVAKVWDSANGQLVATLSGHRMEVHDIAFSPNGEQLATGSRDDDVRRWNVQSGAELRRLPGHAGWVLSLAYGPNGRQIATANQDGTVRLWDAQTGTESAAFPLHPGAALAVRYSPDGARIASAGLDHRLKIWDPVTGKVLVNVRCDSHPGAMTMKAGMLAFSPDGRWIAACTGAGGTVGGEVCVWDSRTGGLAATMRGHSNHINAVAFTPDGTRIASGSNDGTVRLWEAATGREIIALRGHGAGVLSLAFSADGEHLVTGSIDDTVKIWDAPRRSRFGE